MKKTLFLIIACLVMVCYLSGKTSRKNSFLIGDNKKYVVFTYKNLTEFSTEIFTLKKNESERSFSSLFSGRNESFLKVLFYNQDHLKTIDNTLKINEKTRSFDENIFDCVIYKDNIIVCSEKKVFIIDNNFDDIAVFDLPVKKNAHDIMIRDNILYLLDNIMFPYHIFKISLEDIKNPVLISDISINLINGHLNTQFIEKDVWNFTSEENTKTGSRYRLNKVVSQNVESVETGNVSVFPEEISTGYKILKTYIYGNNKYEVRKDLHKNKNIVVIKDIFSGKESLPEISILKDKVFIGKINKYVIIVSGNDIYFFEKNKIVKTIKTTDFGVKTVDYVDFL